MFTTENKPKSTGIASQFLWIFAYFLGVKHFCPSLVFSPISQT